MWVGIGEVYLRVWTPVSVGRYFRRVWVGTEEVYLRMWTPVSGSRH